MQEQINNMEKKIDKLYDAVVGDEIRPGMKSRLEDVEQYQNRDKKQKWTILGGISVLVILREFREELINFFSS